MTRRFKPLLKLALVPPAQLSAKEREALVRKALSIRMTRPYGKRFKRSDAYDA